MSNQKSVIGVNVESVSEDAQPEIRSSNWSQEYGWYCPSIEQASYLPFNDLPIKELAATKFNGLVIAESGVNGLYKLKDLANLKFRKGKPLIRAKASNDVAILDLMRKAKGQLKVYESNEKVPDMYELLDGFLEEYSAYLSGNANFASLIEKICGNYSSIRYSSVSVIWYGGIDVRNGRLMCHLKR